jgi:hypothetical protein
MRQTKDILKTLENRYTNIDYYQTIIQKIEENVEIHPDICIESCKALLEGLSKFIWQQLDSNYDFTKVEKGEIKLQELFKSSLKKLSNKCELFEEDFVNRVGSIIHLLGEIRTKRGDISHGKLSPKEHFSDLAFAKLVYNVTDGIAFYLLQCFSTIPVEKVLEYEDNNEFNEKLDNENPISNLSYSKALFDQDQEAYEQELQLYIDDKETAEENV